jgi:DNA-binding helix-hairpin-helix protein with protein kinase domain
MVNDDPLLTSIAQALREHGITDPRAVLSAADAAVRVLGRDRCICRQAVHVQHHHTPVDRCPWCAKAAAAPPPARKPSTVTVPTGGLL